MIVRRLGLMPYEPTWRAMQAFTQGRGPETPDELWLCEHPPVFTLGLAGKAEHLLRDIGIPVVKTDRGGQVTYHGPGQLVGYLLLDIKRRNLTVKALVSRIEQAVIDLIEGYGVAAERREGAPGVYVNGAKVAALGLKVKNGRTYHGLSLNVAMDLAPFSAINPCGYQGLAVTSLAELGLGVTLEEVATALVARLERQL